MRIVYDDYGGAHSTPLAAALHLGLMQPDRIPTNDELMALPLFDRVTKAEQGCLVFMGADGEGHEVYIIGRGSSGIIVERALASGMVLAGGADACTMFVETLRHVNWWMRIGGFFSRALGWVSLGRPLVLYGTRRAFPQLVKLVDQTKQHVARHQGCLCIVASDGGDLSSQVRSSVHAGVLPGITMGPLSEGQAQQE